MSSTSSIDISSILQALTGSNSTGLKVADLVSSATYAARSPERVWQTQQAALKTENSLLTQANSMTSTLYDDLKELADPLGVMTSLAATSSQTSIVSASVGSGAVAGSHIVEVKELAKTASWYSDYEPSVLPSGSFQIHGSGGDATVTVGSGVNSLDDVAKYINDQKIGVTASVVHDSQGARLAMVSTGSGSANDFSIDNVSLVDGSPFMKLSRGETGTDASISVDGIPINSATNTVSGALTGVTLNLNSAAVGTKVTVSVAQSTSSISKSINSFVTDYNALISGLNGQFKFDPSTGSSGALSGNATARSLQSELLNAMSYSVTGDAAGDIHTLSSMGITMKDDGTLAVDSDKLNNALTNNLSAVQNFFQGTAANGFANTFSDRLSGYTDTTQGAFTVDLKSNKDLIEDLQSHIDDLETYVVSQQAVWTQKYSEAASALMSLPTQLKQIDAMLGNKKD